MCSDTNRTLYCDKKEALRKLFTDHATYTKFYIESSLHSLPDLDAITQRLMKNQEDIGGFVKPIVGTQNGSTLTDLLKQHILMAARAISAVKTGNSKQIDEAVKKVFANSAQVSVFISTLNPAKLPPDAVRQMFDAHNQYVIDMTVSHSQKLYEKEIELFDAYYSHMLMFSDTLYGALSTDIEQPSYSWNYIIILLVVLLVILRIVYIKMA